MTRAASLASAAALGAISKNRIINGAMRVAQRATTTIGNNVFGTYSNLDRWSAENTSGGTINYGQSARDTTFAYGSDYYLSLAGTGITSGGYVGAQQRIESGNIADLAGKKVAISFYTATNIPVPSGNIYIGTPAVADDYTSAVTFTAGFPFTPTTAPGLMTVIVDMPAQAVNGAQIIFRCNAGATTAAAWAYNISSVQVEAGPIITPFERRPHSFELILCQRYFQNLPASSMFGGIASASQGEVVASLPVTMRNTPTVIIPSGTLTYGRPWIGTFAATSNVADIVSPSMAGIAFGGASGLTLGAPCTNAGFGISLNSEM